MSKSIHTLLISTRDPDPDIRFMALNDIDSILTAESRILTSEKRIQYAETLLRTIKDEFDEVRVQTLKCLSNFARVFSDELPALVKGFLSMNKFDSPSNGGNGSIGGGITSTIYTMAVHNILKSMAIPEDKFSVGAEISHIIFNYVVFCGDNKFLTQIDLIESTVDLVEFAGKYLNSEQVNQISNWIINGTINGDNLVGKKCITCLKYLMDYIKDIPNLMNKINSLSVSSQNHKLKSLQLFKSSLEGSPKLLDPYLESLLELINQCANLEVSDDFDLQLTQDELTIEALELLNLVVLLTPTTSIGSAIWNKLPHLLTYDPYGSNDQDEDQDIAENDDDDEYSGLSGDEYSDDDDDVYDDDQDENQGLSSKVRQTTLKIIKTMVISHPLTLPQIYQSLFENLLNQLNIEQNKSVIFSIVDLLTFLFKATSKDEAYYGIKSITNHQPNLRRNSDITMNEKTDPLSELNEHLIRICDLFINKVLAMPVSNENQSLYYDFPTQLTKTIGLPGLPNDYAEKIVVGLNNLLGSSSRQIEVKFYSIILQNNNISSLGQGWFMFIKFIQGILGNHPGISNVPTTHNRLKNSQQGGGNHKLTVDCIQLCIDIFQNIIPRDFPSPEMTNSLINSVSEGLIQRTGDRNLGVDIRKLSLLALKSMTIIYPQPNSEYAQNILMLLEQTMRIDLLVSLSLQYLNDIVSSGKLQPFITLEWANTILDGLLDYLGTKDLCLAVLKCINTFVQLNLILPTDLSHKVRNSLMTINLEILEEKSVVQWGDAMLACLSLPDPSIDVNEMVRLIIELNHYEEFNNQCVPQMVNKLIQITGNSQGLIDLSLAYGSFGDSSIAKFIGDVCLCSRNEDSISKVIDDLRGGVEIVPSLIFINEVSRNINLGISLDEITKYFSIEGNSDEIFNEAIKTASTIVSSNLNEYLPHLLSHLSTQKLPVLKTLIEVITKSKLDFQTSDLILTNILDSLAASSEIGDEVEISITAHCISYLVLQNHSYLEKYIINTLIAKDISLWTSLELTLAAVTKYLFNDPALIESIGIASMRQLLELSTKQLIFDDRLTVKTIGIGNLNVALVKTPIIGVSQMVQILPEIMEKEIKVNKAYVRIQQIGPFKNKIDDGLNYRKQIFECIYYLCKSLEETPALKAMWDIQWSAYINKFFDVTVKDDLGITPTGILAISIIMRLDKYVFAQEDSIQLLIERSNKVINKKMPDGAVKQELEKQVSLIKMVVRNAYTVQQYFERGVIVLKPHQQSQWAVFFAEIRKSFPQDC